MSNHTVGMQSPNIQRQAESLPTLIEQIGNELEILDKHYHQATILADRLHGAPPPPVSSAGLTAVQSEPDSLLGKLRSRLDRLISLNGDLGAELARINNGL